MTPRCGAGGGVEWPRRTLAEIAPASPADHKFTPGEEVWHLGLEHIESHTGRVTLKLRAPAEAAGNSTFAFDERNVLYSKLRPYLNKVVVPDEAGIATTELMPLRPRPNLVVRKYLAYYLRSAGFLSFASQFVAGAKMPRVILDSFWAHEIPLPPLSEQRRIVEVLDQADRLRRLRAEADAKADRILPALFIKMFGDPATNPMGWPVGDLGDAVLETQYGTSKHANSDGRGVLVVRMNNISSSGRVELTEVKYVELDDSELERHRLKPGDLLFNRTNSIDLVGKTGLWNQSGEPAVVASYLIRVRVDPSKALPEYVWALMNSAFVKTVLANKARRAVGMANINATELRRLPALFPPLQLQQAFGRRLWDLELCAGRRRRAAGALGQLFGNLVNGAFSGSLTASWRVAHMKELLKEMEEQAKALAEVES